MTRNLMVALLHRDGPIHVLESDAHAELRAAFTALAQRRTSPSESDLATLRGQVEGLVDAMKGNGALPERIVVVVNSLAKDTGVLWAIDGRLPDHLVDWCVERYYRPNAP